MSWIRLKDIDLKLDENKINIIECIDENIKITTGYIQEELHLLSDLITISEENILKQSEDNRLSLDKVMQINNEKISEYIKEKLLGIESISEKSQEKIDVVTKEILNHIEVNKFNILEQLNSNYENNVKNFEKFKEESFTSINKIEKDQNKIIQNIDIISENNAKLENKIKNLDNKLDSILFYMKDISIHINKTIENFNNNINEKIQKESDMVKLNFENINIELNNLNELTKMILVNNISSIIEEVK